MHWSESPMTVGFHPASDAPPGSRQQRSPAENEKTENEDTKKRKREEEEQALTHPPPRKNKHHKKNQGSRGGKAKSGSRVLRGVSAAQGIARCKCPWAPPLPNKCTPRAWGENLRPTSF